MADTIAFFRLVLRGDYAASETALADEEWSIGFSLYPQLSAVPDIGSPDGSFQSAGQMITYTDANGTYESNYLAEGGQNDVDPAAYLRDQFRAAYVSLIGTTSIFTFTKTKLTSAVLYPMKVVNGDFKVCNTDFGPAKAVFTPTTPPAGNAGNLQPLQSSMVASFRTANATRRGRGRVYLPGLGSSSLDASGMISSTARTNNANAMATFLAALQYTTGAGPALEVAPVVIGRPGSTFYKIKRVSVGSIVDAQRRRRNALTETYANADVAY